MVIRWASVEQDVCLSFGIACAIASAASTVVGMLLQKVGLQRDRQSIFKIGVFTFVVLKPGGQIIALYFAPISIVAPLACVSILLNAAIVPWFQDEKLRQRDMLAGILLVAGCAAATILGSHDNHGRSFPEVVSLAMTNAELTVALFVLVLAASLLLKFARTHISGQPFAVVGVALVPSIASALNNVILKVFMNLAAALIKEYSNFKSEEDVQQLVQKAIQLSPFPVMIALTAFLQVWSTTVGLGLFDMLLFVPVQVAQQILLTTWYGLIFFDEEPSNLPAFAIAIGVIVCGVLMSQPGSKDTSDGSGYQSLEDVPNEMKASSLRTVCFEPGTTKTSTKEDIAPSSLFHVPENDYMGA